MRRGEVVLPQGRLETGAWGPGPETAPTLVLLHEGLGSLGLWRDFPERLAAATGSGAFAYSRFGYGGSDAAPLPLPLDYLQREARDVLPAVLDAAGLRRGLLVGHSDGASIAAAYAGSRADPRVAGLVLMAPHFMTEPAGLAAIAAARDAYQAGELRARLARHHRDPDAAFWGWNHAWLDPDFPARLDLRPALAGIAVPVLFVQNEDDPYGTLEQLAVLRATARAPVDALIVPGQGHHPHVQARDAVIGAIAAFARRLLATAEPEI